VNERLMIYNGSFLAWCYLCIVADARGWSSAPSFLVRVRIAPVDTAFVTGFLTRRCQSGSSVCHITSFSLQR